ncbi:4609_t:CDS:2, partial [Entrophospora sp. SA101]
LHIDVQVAQYKIARGGSYIKTPKKPANTKGTINPDNSETKDNEHLKHAISAFNAHRISKVPVSNHIFKKLEKLNPDYYFNVNDWDDKSGGKEKMHYLWIKNPNKLIFTNTNHKGKKHLCTRGGEYSTSEKTLRKHQKYCHGHTDVPQFTELPEKGKNDKLSFKKWKHMMRAPCVIYSDFGSYNKKCPDGAVYRGQIKKLTKNVPNSYHIIVKWSDGEIWSNEYPYRGENPTENLLKS